MVPLPSWSSAYSWYNMNPVTKKNELLEEPLFGSRSLHGVVRCDVQSCDDGFHARLLLCSTDRRCGHILKKHLSCMD